LRTAGEGGYTFYFIDLTTHLYISYVLSFFSGNDTVALGGYGNVPMARTKYNYAKAPHKPTAMTLRLVDSIFTRETLQCSTVHGTKEYAPLDQEIIAAIKGGSNYT